MFISILLLSMQLASAEVARQTITGMVQDKTGKPVPGTGVDFAGIVGSQIDRDFRTTTDSSGKFAFPDLAEGVYRVYLWNDQLGVPNQRALIFESKGQQFQTVVVGPRSKENNVLITLPDPLGAISGQITDAENGTLVKSARLELRRAEERDVSYATDPASDGTYKFYLPARPIIMSVSAPGYETWQYRTSQGGDLFLDPGVDLTLPIHLKLLSGKVSKTK